MVTWRDPIYLAAGAASALATRIDRLFSKGSDAPKQAGPESKADVHYMANISGIQRPSDDAETRFGTGIYEEMVREDSEIANGLDELVAAVISAPWQVEPGNDSAASEAASELCSLVMTNLGRQRAGIIQTPDSIQEELLHTALARGMAVAEIVWTQERSGKIIPDWLAFRPHTQFTWLADSSGVLTGLQSSAIGDNSRVYEPWRFVLLPYQAFLGQVIGTARTRRILRAYLMRKMLQKLQGIAFQKGASGSLIGKMSRQDWGDTKLRNAYLAALEKINAESVTVIPAEWQYEAVTMMLEGTKVITEALKHYADEIRIGLLGSTLPTDSGDKGTQALGTVQADTRATRIGLLRNIEAATWERFLFEPTCKLNFDVSSADFAYPKFVRASQAQPKIADDAVWMKTLAEIGAEFEPEWINDTYGIKVANEPGQLLGFSALRQSQPQQPMMAHLEANAAEQRWIELATREQREIDRLTDEAMSKLQPLWAEAVAWAQSHQTELLSGAKVPGREDRIKAFVRTLRAGSALGIALIARRKLAHLGEGDDDSDSWEYDDFLPEATMDEMNTSIGNRYWSEFEDGMGERWNQAMRGGMAEGKSTKDIADDMGAMSGKKAPYTAARTAMNEAYNTARTAAGREAAWVDGWHPIGGDDERTTPMCEEIHRKYYAKADTKFLNPPYHYNCRTSILPVELDEVPGRKWDEWAENRNKPEPGFGRRV